MNESENKIELLEAKLKEKDGTIKTLSKLVDDLRDEITHAAKGKGFTKKGLVEVKIDGQYAYVTSNAQKWMAEKARQCEELFKEVIAYKRIQEIEDGLKKGVLR